ncbi:MAG: glycosyltransferase [Bacteroidales bacterium]|nr:glycosyltransferase [Bacteroidales bacterium]
MKKILIFTYMDITRDPRAHRQIKWLKENYTVHCVCESPDPSYGITYTKYKNESSIFSKLKMFYLKFGFFNKYTWNKNHVELANELSKIKFDLIIAHHIKLLPIAVKISKGAKIILDAHEFYTEIYADSFIWRFFMKKYYYWLSNTFLKKCDLIITVNESLKQFYEKEFHISTSFISNAVDFSDMLPSKTNANNIKIIHHGQASRSRKIELMIEMMKYMDTRFTLTLIITVHGIPSKIYLKKLKNAAKGYSNIKFAKTLPYKEIVPYGNKFDIGLFFMPPVNINEEFSTGNKVYQYIQSRLMLAFSPLPEMKKIVDDYDLGVCSDDYNPKSLAVKLNKLTAEKIDYFKSQSHKHAKTLSSEMNKEKFISLIEKVIEN